MLPEETESHSSVPVQTSALGSIYAQKGRFQNFLENTVDQGVENALSSGVSTSQHITRSQCCMQRSLLGLFLFSIFVNCLDDLAQCILSPMITLMEIWFKGILFLQYESTKDSYYKTCLCPTLHWVSVLPQLFP